LFDLLGRYATIGLELYIDLMDGKNSVHLTSCRKTLALEKKVNFGWGLGIS